jgi:hypothetical protein
MGIIVELLLKEELALTDRLEEVRRLIAEAMDKENVAVTFKHQGSYSIGIVPKLDGFPVKGTYLAQILYIITEKNRFLHNKEITEELINYHKGVDKSWLKRRVSAVLSHGLKDVNTLTNVRFSNSKQDTVWGKKEWLNNDGTIKDEFVYSDKIKTVQSKINF